MKAVALVDAKKFKVIDVPEPNIKNDDDVLIKIKRVGVCGSDMHYYKSGKIGTQVIEFPFISGHECSGVVEAVGKNVNRVKPGDIISIDPALSCGHCSQCGEGRYHTCLNNQFLGAPGQLDGALQEKIVMPQECCYKGAFNLSEAVLIEPLSISLYSTTFVENIKEKKIGILGFGPIGIGVILSLKAKGVKNITVTDKLDYRLELSERMGSKISVNPEKTDVVKAIYNKYEGGLDVIFECSGDQAAIEQAIQLLKPGGKLLIIGIPDSKELIFDPHLMRRKEINIQNVRRQNKSVDATVSLIEDKLIEPNFMVTHEFHYLKAGEAFELVSKYKDGVIKALINFD